MYSVKNWISLEKSFQEELDTLNNLKIDELNRIYDQKLKCVVKSFPELKTSSKFTQAYNDYRQLFYLYLTQRTYFGTDIDYKRVITHRELVKSKLAIKKFLEAKFDLSTVSINDQALRIWQKTLDIPYYLNITGKLYLDKSHEQGETPVLDALNKGVRKLGRDQNVIVNWDGLNLLPQSSYDGKTLNIIAFEHAHSYLDTIAQANIPKDLRKGTGFFGAATFIFPAYWVKQLQKSDEYIVVNQGKEIQKTLDVVSRKRLDKFCAAAEGLSPAGVYDTRPVSPLFLNTYYALRQKGLKVNLTPMTFPKNFRPYNQWLSNDTSKIAKGVVSRPLSSKAADKLVSLTGDKKSIAYWLRATWHESMITDGKLFLSAPPFSDLIKQVNQVTWDRLDEVLPVDCKL